MKMAGTLLEVGRRGSLETKKGANSGGGGGGRMKGTGKLGDFCRIKKMSSYRGYGTKWTVKKRLVAVVCKAIGAYGRAQYRGF